MNLTGRSAIITGASRGLGRAIATRLAFEGAHVMLTARDAATLESTAAEIKQLVAGTGQQVACTVANVGNPVDVDRLLTNSLDANGRVDALICNAGTYGPIGRVEDQDWEEWVSAVETNLFGTVLCCRAVLPVMRRQQYGKIVVLSGGGATQPLPRFSAYAAAKAAVVRFAETLAAEVKDSGIDVNAIAPGALNTRLLDEVLAAGSERAGHEFFERAVRQKAEGGAPLELAAELVALLVSSASDGITGRLISALWDDWRALPELRERLNGSDVYTLRRITPEDRGWASS